MRKPSEIKTVSAKNALMLPSSYTAIMLFGTIYCNNYGDVQEINKTEDIDSTLKCHETIHVRQAEDAKNSWFIYYCRYIWQWLQNIPLMFIKFHYAYYFIPYELEAYANEDNFDYALGEAKQWKLFAEKLSTKDKKKFAKEYKKSKMIFKDFVKKIILPKLN